VFSLEKYFSSIFFLKTSILKILSTTKLKTLKKLLKKIINSFQFACSVLSQFNFEISKTHKRKNLKIAPAITSFNESPKFFHHNLSIDKKIYILCKSVYFWEVLYGTDSIFYNYSANLFKIIIHILLFNTKIDWV
jgi:hypothetical protein